MTKAKATKKSKRDYETELVEGLITLMEEGTNPWEKDWRGRRYGDHRNLVTGHVYTGSNPALLELQMAMRGVDIPLWIPFGAGKTKGWHPRKGSKGCCLVMPFQFEKDVIGEDGKPVLNPDTGEAEREMRIGFTYKGGIFNAMDMQGKDEASQATLDKAIADAADCDEGERSEPERHEEAEAVLGNWGVPVRWGGERAFYSPTTDAITLPQRDSFRSASGLYATWAHEAVHSTGHESRLKRDGIVNFGGFGSPSYAREELIAELGAFLLCTRLQISSRVDNHASYLDHWIKCLKEKPGFLMTALSAAKKASQAILPEEQVVLKESKVIDRAFTLSTV